MKINFEKNMAPDTEGLAQRLIRIIIAFFLNGLILIAASEYFLASEAIKDKGWKSILLKIVLELGIAFIIASIVAFTFERLLSRERLIEIGKLLGEYREMEHFGFKKIFATRQVVFDELFEKSIPNARHDLKVMGICVSLFKEARREPRPATQPNANRIRDILVDKIIKGCKVHILYLKRYPKNEELKSYGIDGGDFFSMRERDEDEDINFLHGKRLKKIANDSHGDWIQILIALADRIKESKQYNTEESRRQLFDRLQVREYFALPSVSLYIIDQSIYVTPYLYKKHCSDVPAIKIVRRDSPLYESYESHFEAAWKDKFTSSAIPQDFINALIKDPGRSLQLYKEKKEEVLQQRRSKELANQTYNEDPDYYRIEEEAIELFLEAQKTIEEHKISTL